MTTPKRAEIIIVGGGIIGSLIAYFLRQGGAETMLVDAAKKGAATHASAGLLVPGSDAPAWALESFERYPSLIQELEAASGLSIPHAIEGLYLHPSHQAVVPPTGSQVLKLQGEATFPPRFRDALQKAFTAMGGELLQAEAMRIEAGCVQLAGGKELRADRVVLAAGAWSARLLAGLKVYPLKGEALLLDAPPPPAPVFAGEGYALPREGGVYLGATMRASWLEGVELAGLGELLDYARRSFPHLAAARFSRSLWGFRPGGPLTVKEVDKGLFVAAGHGAYGVSLAPATAVRVVKALGVRLA